MEDNVIRRILFWLVVVCGICTFSFFVVAFFVASHAVQAWLILTTIVCVITADILWKERVS